MYMISYFSPFVNLYFTEKHYISLLFDLFALDKGAFIV